MQHRPSRCFIDIYVKFNMAATKLAAILYFSYIAKILLDSLHSFVMVTHENIMVAFKITFVSASVTKLYLLPVWRPPSWIVGVSHYRECWEMLRVVSHHQKCWKPHENMMHCNISIGFWKSTRFWQNFNRIFVSSHHIWFLVQYWTIIIIAFCSPAIHR